MFDLYELFKSVDIIADAKVKAAQSTMDRTIICSIINNDKKDYGEYVVQYEGTKITAHCSDTDYELEDLVYVGVPEGDYSNAYIIAKKIDEAHLINVANPFEGFIQMVKNTADQKNIKDIDFATLQAPTEIFSKQYTNELEKFTSLGIEFNLVSKFANSFQNSEYGFLVYVQTRHSMKNSQTPIYRSHPFVFSSRDMVGNAFNFVGEANQKKLIDISDLDNIDSIKVYAFSHFGVNEQPNPNDYAKILKVEVSLGYALNEGLEESLYLYSSEKLEYDYSNKDMATSIPLFLRWLYKEDDVIKAITVNNLSDKPTNATIQWEQFKNNEWVILPQYKNAFFINVDTLDRFKANESFRCSVLYESFDSDAPIEYNSNVITIKNIEKGASNIIVDSSVRMETDVLDFSVLYAPDGTVLDLGETFTIREACFMASMEKIELDSSISIQLKWKFYNNSMIEPYGFINEENSKEQGTASTQDNGVYFEKILISGSDAALSPTIINGKIVEKFYFTLKDFYTPLNKNNKITCEISVIRSTDNKEEILQTDIVDLVFDFKRNGICKNDKVMQLSMYNSNKERVRAIKPHDTVTIEAIIYDCNGTQLALSNDIEWSWFCKPYKLTASNQWSDNGQYNNDGFMSGSKINLNTCSLTANNISVDEIANQDLCYILEATYIEKNSDNKVVSKVVGYLPIAINFRSDILKCLSGPTSIYYNSSGGEPQYYNSAYSLFRTNNQILNNVYWYMVVQGVREKATTIYPIIGEVDGSYYLSPKATYTKDANKHCAAVAQVGGTIVWIQPILIAQTNSFSSFINDWDGSFSLDEAGNQLMAARLGAGKKNGEDNTFSGVLLGDWTESVEDGSVTTTGVYGFDHNIQAYALKEDGTAFFGKPGDGRINFNGNMGLIYSGNFDGLFYEADAVWDNPEMFAYALQLPSGGFYSYDNKFANFDYDIERKMIIIKDKFEYNQGGVLLGGNGGRRYPSDTEPYFSINIGDLGAQEFADANNKPYGGIDLLFEYEISVANLSIAQDGGSNAIKASLYIPFDKDDLYTTYPRFKSNSKTIECDTYSLISIGSTQDDIVLSTYDWLPLYYGMKLKMKYLLHHHFTDGVDINELGSMELQLPLMELGWYNTNTTESGSIGSRDYEFEISNIKLSLLNNTEQKQISEIEKNKNIDKTILAHEGEKGTFINLRDGQFITNGGIFRGALQVESMTLLNDLIVGDSTGVDDNWVKISRKGELMGGTATINHIKVKRLGEGSVYNGQVEFKAISGTEAPSDDVSLNILPAGIRFFVSSSSNYFRVGPEGTDSVAIEDNQQLLGNWLCTGSLGFTSDERLKNVNDTINQDKYDTLFNNIVPIEYTYKSEGKYAKKHIGFGANNVIAACQVAGIKPEEMSLIGFNQDSYLEEYNTYPFILNYIEFIALNTAQIKKLQQRVNELEKLLELRDKGGKE